MINREKSIKKRDNNVHSLLFKKQSDKILSSGAIEALPPDIGNDD